MTNNQSLSQSELTARLLELNQQPNQPFKVEQNGDQIIASWNIVDAQWLQFFTQAGMSEQYTLTLTFHPEKKFSHNLRYFAKRDLGSWFTQIISQSIYFQRSNLEVPCWHSLWSKKRLICRTNLSI